MKAVITGDIINSQSIQPEIWLKALHEVFGGADEKRWEIYRGDEFQYLLDDPAEAFSKSIEIKSKIKNIPGLDVRLSIGIGGHDFLAPKVTQSNGSAFVNSGRNFERIKAEKLNLSICSDHPEFDEMMNLTFKWMSVGMDNWSVVSAEIVNIFIRDSDQNQEQVAQQLNISQSSVSQRLKRANYDLIAETDLFFRKKIAQL
ncbi:SatD family protein [Chryseobacterium sp. MFBS3-17]|uniref:SatD family protein n=1 Tax=Chryseobacterium sp. MFBS3-17 TaxID=2886689 RepID=UPI001D0E0D51|nr:SatD family protein [Chryseobacterium sp. MFBS3-17]MCC2589816.1 SatD family protein [Chryseobacterium sp. MFBS3-17]